MLPVRCEHYPPRLIGLFDDGRSPVSVTERSLFQVRVLILHTVTISPLLVTDCRLGQAWLSAGQVQRNACPSPLRGRIQALDNFLSPIFINREPALVKDKPRSIAVVDLGQRCTQPIQRVQDLHLSKRRVGSF